MAKLYESRAREKQTNLLSQGGEIPRRCWLVVKIGDEELWSLSFSLSTYSQKPMPMQSRQNRPLGCFAEHNHPAIQLQRRRKNIAEQLVPHRVNFIRCQTIVWCHHPSAVTVTVASFLFTLSESLFPVRPQVEPASPSCLEMRGGVEPVSTKGIWAWDSFSAGVN